MNDVPEPLPKSRAEAKRTGSKFYFTGTPCPRGHVDVRYASTSNCKSCGRESSKARYSSDPKKFREYNRIQYQKHRPKRLEGLKQYKKENPEIIRRLNAKRDKVQLARSAALYRAADPIRAKAQAKAHRIKNRVSRNQNSQEWRSKNKERISNYNREYRNANRIKLRSYEGAFHKSVRRATPSWADRPAIQQIYAIRDQLNDMQIHGKFQVDHIIPLKGKNEAGQHIVCGLHVATNLQVVPQGYNSQKRHRFDPYNPHQRYEDADHNQIVAEVSATLDILK